MDHPSATECPASPGGSIGRAYHRCEGALGRGCGRASRVAESISVLIPFDSSRGVVAAETGRRLASSVAQVVLVGPDPVDVDGASVELVVGTNGSGLRSGLDRLREPITVVLEPYAQPTIPELRAICQPIVADEADVVLGGTVHSAGAALNALARTVAGVRVRSPLAPVRAVRTEVLRSLNLVSQGSAVTAELLVKLAAQCFRFGEVGLQGHSPSRSPRALWTVTSTLLRYGLFHNDADNTHEGYNTLLQMDQAPRYNAWLGRKLRHHLGKRVLEIGAGIGTITREIAEGPELVIALEADAFYAQRLRNLFRGSSVVRVLHAAVEATDWKGLAGERLDTVMLSNVLEHIKDDHAAIRNFRSVIPEGGALVALVPALQGLYGSIDEAIGHFRRYDPSTLRNVIESNGFELQSLEWLNLLGIPGWYVNSRLLKRRAVPGLQIKLYDRLAPFLARAESAFRLPVGMSLLAVARAAPT